MDIDTDKIDDAVLALLQLTLHDANRAWKGHDWDVMDRLYQKGFIDNPADKAKSVVLTDEGLRQSERLFEVIVSSCEGVISPTCRSPTPLSEIIQRQAWKARYRAVSARRGAFRYQVRYRRPTPRTASRAVCRPLRDAGHAACARDHADRMGNIDGIAGFHRIGQQLALRLVAAEILRTVE